MFVFKKESVTTRAALGGPRNDREKEGLALLTALDCRFQLAPRRELRHAGGRDRDLLTRARVDALPLLALLRRKLPKAREGHLLAAAQSLRDRIKKCVDSLCRVTLRQPALRRDPVDEVSFRHCLSFRLCRGTARQPNRKSQDHATMRVCGPFQALMTACARKSGSSRTASRASASAPPSSRSTTQTAARQVKPASRRARTASTAAPPLVTTSSTRQTS